eukprot:12773041-Alexandrium_andersonii.AAC.1
MLVRARHLEVVQHVLHPGGVVARSAHDAPGRPLEAPRYVLDALARGFRRFLRSDALPFVLALGHDGE